MNPRTRHKNLLKNIKVKRWYENLKARSQVTSDVYLRNFGLWLEYLNESPDSIIDLAKNDFQEFKGRIADQIRRLENKGLHGSGISTSIKPLISYLKFNDVVVRLNINIKNENRNLNAEKEIIPTKEELAKILRIASEKERASISLIAFSGLRPEVLGNIDGSDGLILSDLIDFDINKLEFTKIPCQINIRPELSKIRQRYFSFIGLEGAKYLKEYFELRRSKGEVLKADSPVIKPDENMQRSGINHKFQETTLLLRMIKKYILKAGFSWRPYIFRVYFGTNLDIAESKGMISHPWRQFIMGHKGDIEESYTRREGIIDEGREAYRRCLPFIETESRGLSIEESESLEKKLTLRTLKMLGFTDQESEELSKLDDEELQKKIREKLGMKLLNGNSQKVISIKEIENFINQGWEFISTIPGDKAIIRFPH